MYVFVCVCVCVCMYRVYMPMYIRVGPTYICTHDMYALCMCIHACWRACIHTNGYVGMHGSTHAFTYARVIHVGLMLGCMAICLPTYSSYVIDSLEKLTNVIDITVKN